MNILLASTSTLYGEQFLEYLRPQLQDLYQDIDEILFVPFARPGGMSYESYTELAKNFFATMHINVRGLHEFEDKIEAINQAKAYFTGGGNTFLLVKTLHEEGLMSVLKTNVELGKAYLGCSAGSNIGGLSMKTSNDMPIVYPPSFDCMGLVPFNINPHYLDPHPELHHNGETRETRILEFLTQNDIKVVGLREGNWIRKIGEKITVEGSQSTRIFERDKQAYEIAPGTEL